MDVYIGRRNHGGKEGGGAMNFAGVEAITIPDGKVALVSDDAVLWSAYQKVAWIGAASGVEAYLDLGFAFDEGCKMEVEIYYDLVYSTRTYFFGAAEDSLSNRFMLIGEYSADINGIYIASKTNSGTNLFYSVDPVEGYNKITVQAGDGSCIVTNETTGATYTNTFKQGMAMSANAYLFANNYNGAPRYDTGNARKIGRFSYYDKTGVLICDLYPCYRKSDSVIGMYDAARKKFLTNDGTGTFIKEGDV